MEPMERPPNQPGAGGSGIGCGAGSGACCAQPANPTNNTAAAKAFTWPKHSLMGDEHKGITKLADHFKVEHNRCIYHKTSKFAHDFN